MRIHILGWTFVTSKFYQKEMGRFRQEMIDMGYPISSGNADLATLELFRRRLFGIKR